MGQGKTETSSKERQMSLKLWEDVKIKRLIGKLKFMLSHHRLLKNLTIASDGRSVQQWPFSQTVGVHKFKCI